jgi:hypothetical protein
MVMGEHGLGRLLVAILLLAGAPARAQSPTAAGFWQSSTEEGRPDGWFYFSERNGYFEGRLVRTFDAEGLVNKPDVCRKCPGEQRNAPLVGLMIVSGMKRESLEYDGGQILDPRDGSLYHAQMSLSPDGRQLSLRGYIGVPMLGQTRVWTRLSDNSLPPEAILGLPPPPVKGALRGSLNSF